MEKYKTLLKDSEEDLNKWGASAFLSMNMAYHKEVALQTDLWTQCCFISHVKRVFKNFHPLILIHIWKSKEPTVVRTLLSKKHRGVVVMMCVCLFHQM